jgi:hypothetical protein
LRRFSILISIFLCSCIKNSADSGRSFRIPWPDAQNRYTLQDIEIKTFDEPQFLRGSLAEFYLQPEILLKDGKLAQPGVPSGHFLATPSGSQVALDDASLQAATLYAHIEKLNELDQSSGAAAYLPARPSIGLDVGFIDQNKNVLENNAQYTPGVDAILFLPYTQSELPITLNAGVVAHEHFHSIFHHIVLSHFDSKLAYGSVSLNESPPRDAKEAPKDEKKISIEVYNRYLLRGVNEGLADFWGWIYSGDETFVGRSIPSALEARRLDKIDPLFFDLTTFKFVMAQVDSDGPRVGQAYLLGSQYAVYLRNILLKVYKKRTDAETRAKFAKVLVNALFKFETELEKRISTEYLPPEIFIASFFKALNEETKELGDFDFCKSYTSVAPFSTDKIKQCESSLPVAAPTPTPETLKAEERHEK